MCPERQILQRLSKGAMTVYFPQSSSHVALSSIKILAQVLWTLSIWRWLFIYNSHQKANGGWAAKIRFWIVSILGHESAVLQSGDESPLFSPLHPRKLWPHLFNYQHGKVHYHWLCCWRCLISPPLCSSPPSSSFVKSRWIYNAAIPSVVNHFSRPRPRDQNEHFDEL